MSSAKSSVARRLSDYVRPATLTGRSISLVQEVAKKWDLPVEIQTLIEFNCHRDICPLVRPLDFRARNRKNRQSRSWRWRRFQGPSFYTRDIFEKRHVCWSGWTGCTCQLEFCLCRPIPFVRSTPSGIKVSATLDAPTSATATASFAQQRQLKQHYTNWK